MFTNTCPNSRRRLPQQQLHRVSRLPEMNAPSSLHTPTERRLQIRNSPHLLLVAFLTSRSAASNLLLVARPLSRGDRASSISGRSEQRGVASCRIAIHTLASCRLSGHTLSSFRIASQRRAIRQLAVHRLAVRGLAGCGIANFRLCRCRTASHGLAICRLVGYKIACCRTARPIDQTCVCSNYIPPLDTDTSPQVVTSISSSLITAGFS